MRFFYLPIDDEYGDGVEHRYDDDDDDYDQDDGVYHYDGPIVEIDVSRVGLGSGTGKNSGR